MKEKRIGAAFVALFAFAITASALRNGFALDDVHIIQDNARVHSLASFWQLFSQTYWPPEEGASLYRPLTMLAFAVQWVIGNGSPFVFHMVSGILYAATCVSFYVLAAELVSHRVALIAALLFSVHPVHVEVFANVVGQAEMWVALLMFVATTLYIRARRRSAVTRLDIVLISALFAAACLSKEHAIILPAILVAADLILFRSATERRLRDAAPLFACLIIVGIAFVVLRTIVAGGVQAAGSNELFRGQPAAARVLTMLTVVVEWLRLFFWPSQLSADYSFPRTTVATEFTASMLPGILVLAGCAVVAWRMRRQNPVITFAFTWTVIALAIPSNLVVVTGFVLAERTLFLASAGVVLMVAMAAAWLWDHARDQKRVVRVSMAAAAGFVLVAGTTRSLLRAPVWRDNDSLFRQTVQDVPSSARAHWMLAVHLSETQGPRAGAEEVLLAAALGRKDDPLLLGSAADQLNMAGMCPAATGLYLRALRITPLNIQLRVNTAMCLLRTGRISEARSVATAGPPAAAGDLRIARVVTLADSLAADRSGTARLHPRQM